MRCCSQSIASIVLMVTVACAGYASAAPAASAAKYHNYRDKNFDYFVAGNPSLPRAAHTESALALMGGGGSVDAAFSAIAKHAGAGHILILRAVADDSFDPEDGHYGELFMTQWGPVASAQTIVFHTRAASFDPRVIAALSAADGIFLAGGDQGNYIRYWKGTPVQQALNAHVLANRPIGGSSAGLAILGHYSYTSLDGGSMESKTALADPYNSGMTLENDFLHFRYLENVVTDSHFSQRSRLGRLIVFVARFDKDRPRAGIFGIGLDEKTALVIDANGVGKLAMGSAGNAWLVIPRKPPTVLLEKQPLTMEDIRIVRLGLKGSIDLKSRAVRLPAAETTDFIERGSPHKDVVTDSIMLRSLVPSNES